MKLKEKEPSPVSALFNETLNKYGITGKELSEISGVSENHISEFRRGKGDVSTAVLFRLLEAMNLINPEARDSLCRLLAGRKSNSVGELLVQLVELADDTEIDELMLAIAHRIKSSSSKRRGIREFTGALRTG